MAGHLAVVRFVVGALVSLVLFWLRPGLYRPRNRRLLVSRGLSGGVVVVLYFTALARIPAGEAGLIYNLFPVIASAGAFFVFGERPTAHLIVGLVMATTGVVLVLGHGALRLGAGWGEAAALASAVFAAASANIIRGMRSRQAAPTIFFWFCLAGLVVVLPFGARPLARFGDGLGAGPGGWPVRVRGAGAHDRGLRCPVGVGGGRVATAHPIAQYALALPLLGERPRLAGLLGVGLAVAGVAYGSALGHRSPAAVRRRAGRTA